MSYRLPDYAASAPLHLLMPRLGLDQDEPRDVLVALVCRLAARLERRVGPWDAEGGALTGARSSTHLPVGGHSVHLEARVGQRAELVAAHDDVASGSALAAAAAALHQLLAAHPEVGTMPLRWTVDAENGVSAACLEYMDPGVPEFAKVLAHALGTSVDRTEFRALYQGERKVCLSLDGEIDGVMVTFTGYALAAGGGE
jgi:hypothetical protein